MNTIEYENKALKQMKRLPKDISTTIVKAIQKLIDYPNWQGLDIKALNSHKYNYRLRVTRYRVFFDIEKLKTKNDEIYYNIVILEVKNVMNKPTNPQIIRHDGKPLYAIVPWSEYQDLIKNQLPPDRSGVRFPEDVAHAHILHDESLIKAWREHFGMTQAELAKKAGMQQSTLARLESGNTSPRKATLVKLANAMDISVEQLIE